MNMKRAGNVNMLNEALSEQLKDKIFLLLCNSNLTKEHQQKLMKMINRAFLEGKGDVIDNEEYFDNFPSFED